MDAEDNNEITLSIPAASDELLSSSTSNPPVEMVKLNQLIKDVSRPELIENNILEEHTSVINLKTSGGDNAATYMVEKCNTVADNHEEQIDRSENCDVISQNQTTGNNYVQDKELITSVEDLNTKELSLFTNTSDELSESTSSIVINSDALIDNDKINQLKRPLEAFPDGNNPSAYQLGRPLDIVSVEENTSKQVLVNLEESNVDMELSSGKNEVPESVEESTLVDNHDMQSVESVTPGVINNNQASIDANVVIINNDGDLKGKQVQEFTSGIRSIDAYRNDWTSDSDSSSDDSDSSSCSSSSSSCSSDSDGDGDVKRQREAFSKEAENPAEAGLGKLPPIENLAISVNVSEISLLGEVTSVVGELVVVQAKEKSNPLDLDSILFLENGEALGKVFDVFGQVSQPYYSVRFNTPEEITDKKVEIGQQVYCAPDHPEFTTFVFMEQLKKIKPSDGSWIDDDETPVDFCEFSDDEEEKRLNRKQENKRTNSSTDVTRQKKPKNKNNKNSVSTFTANKNSVSTFTPSKNPWAGNNNQNSNNFYNPQAFPQNFCVPPPPIPTYTAPPYHNGAPYEYNPNTQAGFGQFNHVQSPRQGASFFNPAYNNSYPQWNYPSSPSFSTLNQPLSFSGMGANRDANNTSQNSTSASTTNDFRQFPPPGFVPK